MESNTTIIRNIGEAAFGGSREDITIDNKTLVLEESIIIKNDINNTDQQANIRMEIYNIDDVVEDDVLYYDFYRGFSNHIAALVLRTLPIDDKPVKYTTYIESLSDRNLHKTRRILSDIEIFLNSVQGITIPMLQNEVRRAISLAEYTDHDYI